MKKKKISTFYNSYRVPIVHAMIRFYLCPYALARTRCRYATVSYNCH